MSKETRDHPMTTGEAIEKPRRAFHLSLEVDADDHNTLLHALDDIAEKVKRRDGKSICGGCSMGWTYELNIDETITHDIFYQRLEDFLEYLSNEKSNAEIAKEPNQPNTRGNDEKE